MSRYYQYHQAHSVSLTFLFFLSSLLSSHYHIGKRLHLLRQSTDAIWPIYLSLASFSSFLSFLCHRLPLHNYQRINLHFCLYLSMSYSLSFNLWVYFLSTVAILTFSLSLSLSLSLARSLARSLSLSVLVSSFSPCKLLVRWVFWKCLCTRTLPVTLMLSTYLRYVYTCNVCWLVLICFVQTVYIYIYIYIYIYVYKRVLPTYILYTYNAVIW